MTAYSTLTERLPQHNHSGCPLSDTVSFTASPSLTDPPSALVPLAKLIPTLYNLPAPDLDDLLPPIAETLDFTFAELRLIGDAMGERRDCAIIATSVVTGYSYPKIHEMYRLLGRRARCTTPWVYVLGVFAQLGLRLNDISKFYDGASLRSIVPQLPDKGSFLIHSRKHVSAVKNSICQDWADERKLYVQGIFEIVDFDSVPNLSPPPARKRKVFIDYSQPTKAVHAIAEILMEEEILGKRLPNPLAVQTRRYWSTFRAKVVAECVANGIHKTTASVQVGKWMKENGLQMGYMIS